MARTPGQGMFGGITSSVATKLIIAMILIATIPLAVTGFIVARNTAQNLQQQTRSSIETIANSTSDAVTQVVAEQIRLVQSLSTAPQIRAQVEAVNGAYGVSDAQAVARVEALDARWRELTDDTDPLIRGALNANPAINPSAYLARQFQEQFPNHVEVFVTDRYGALLGSTNKTSDYYQADEGWWQDAWNEGAGDIHVGEPELDESTGVFAVNLAVPIRNDARELIGVLRSTVDIRTILDIVEAAGFGQTGTAIIVDSTGAILFDPANPASIGQTSGIQVANLQGTGSLVDEDELIGYSTNRRAQGLEVLQQLPWVTLAQIDRSEALAPVTEANRIALIAGGIAFLAAVLAALFLARALTRQVRNVREVFGRIGIGDFKARVDVVSSDEIGQMAEGLNAMLDNTLTLIQSREDRDQIQASIMKLLDEVSGVAEGDLSREAEVTPEITGAIADSFNYMIVELRNLVSDVQATTDGVDNLAVGMQQDMTQLSSISEQQAAEILNASASIGSLAQAAQKVSDQAAESARVAERSVTNANLGASAVQGTIDGMNSIRAQVQETSKRIKRLGESSQEIGEIVQLIGDIAERTSILALNASIQAAMAGPAGQGFGVVAEEVERLSERAAQSTKRISTLVKTIQAETNETVTAMESTTRQVVEGSERANEAGGVLQEMTSVVDQLANSIFEISKEAREQASSSTELSASISQASEASRQSASQTRQAVDQLSDLSELTTRLRRSLERFRLPDDSGRQVA